jgi:hypothetical protein
MQADALNYNPSNMVSVPTEFRARAHSPNTHLAYITDDEAGILQALKPDTPHRGPMNIPNYDSFDAAGGYSNPDTGYAASSGGGGGGWQDTSAQDRRTEQQWQATSDAIKKAEKQKKLIDTGQKGLDAYTLVNALKHGWSYNPVTHGISSLLGMLGKRKGTTGAGPQTSVDWGQYNPLNLIFGGPAQAANYNLEDLKALGAQEGIMGIGMNDQLEALENFYQGAKKFSGTPMGSLDFNSPADIRSKVGRLGDIPFSGYESVNMDLVPQDFLSEKIDFTTQKSPLQLIEGN